MTTKQVLLLCGAVLVAGWFTGRIVVRAGCTPDREPSREPSPETQREADRWFAGGSK
ncbi:MAG TPA: hypothetical protein VFR23_24420 [Jiangellaceae bacterium]|nr:hypothetical protein [Jiangellaceae bacterium]